jgi:alanyl-tRNA synthetase
VLKQEEERFAETLANGMALLEQAIHRVQKTRGDGGGVIPGDVVFKLYDTHGFPVDLTADIARERGLTIDEAGFSAAMEKQREQARAASKFSVDLREGQAALEGLTQVIHREHFQGYEGLTAEGRVVRLIKDGNAVEQLSEGEEGQLFLDRTPFYAESGGQVGDTGVLTGGTAQFIVRDTQKAGGAHAHSGLVTKGVIRVGDSLRAEVNGELRNATALNHTATHLLHAALRAVLGTHVTQKGSLVAPDRLRFDFSHFQPVSADELLEIERRVNAEIRANAPAETQVMAFDKAVEAGAMALFGEKYDSEVRVLRLGSFSMELCGGTHAERAGDIGLFKIVSEGGVAAGVRRIEALTGTGALDYVEQNESMLKDIGGLVRGSRDEIANKVRDALERIKQMEKEIRTLKDKMASGQGSDLSASAIDVQGVKVVATKVEGADAGALRNAVDQLKGKLKSAVIVLASVEGDSKVVLVAGVTADLVARIKAGELVGAIAAKVGGKGGGRPDFAQAGGTQPAALDEALKSVEAFVRGKLG